MPWTLWTYLAADLLRLLVVSAAALVTLVAFAAAVKPLADGDVALLDALKLMGLMIVPMLQYASPFAAGFAATLAYHRFAADREASAAHAAGVPARTLLVPALAVGLVLAAGLFVLMNEVIPHLLRRAEALVTRDAPRLILGPIDRGETVRFAGFDLRADKVYPLPPTVPGAFEHLALLGVMAVRTDDSGRITAEISAERVDILMFDERGTPGGSAAASAGGGGSTLVQLHFTGARGRGPDGQLLQENFYTHRIRIPGRVRDNPKYLPWRELWAVHEDPTRMASVERRRRALAGLLAGRAMLSEMRDGLASSQRVTLVGEGGERVVLSAGSLTAEDAAGAAGPAAAWRLLPREPGGFITIDRQRADGRREIQQAQSGLVRLGEADPRAAAERPAALSIELENVAATQADAGLAPGEGARGVEGERRQRRLEGLRTAGEGEARLLREPLGVLVDAGLASDAATVSAAAASLRDDVDDLRREIVSKAHERVAYALTAVLMVLAGALAAMRLREAMPLPVYLSAFLPALAAFIAVSTGQGLTHRYGAGALVLLYAGCAFLLAWCAGQYLLLRRR
ncbi:MAG: LptF/LptG family permease [Phycisphaerales bacterium]|nr:LptF/LptG family permease [Phycisphaerales bacterium]